MIANGDLPGDGFTPEREKHVAESTAGWVSDSSEETDKDFSTVPCRTCACTLYGARFHACKLGD